MDPEGLISDAIKAIDEAKNDKKKIIEIAKQLVNDIKDTVEDLDIDLLKKLKVQFNAKRIATKEIDALIKNIEDKKKESKDISDKKEESSKNDDDQNKKNVKNNESGKKEKVSNDKEDEGGLRDSILGNSDPDSKLTKDILTIRQINSKILFVDTENDTYSVYIPEQTTTLKPIEIEFKPIQDYKPIADLRMEKMIFLSNRDQVSDQEGPEEVLYTSDFFKDIKNEDIKYFRNYFLEKAMMLRKQMPNVNYMSGLNKETNPLNIQNTICTSFDQMKYYNIVVDRTNRAFDNRRRDVEFDNVTIDGVNRRATVSLRLHPVDDQILAAVDMNTYETQNLADVMSRYQMIAADGYAVTPKIRVDRDHTVIADVRSRVLARICVLSPYVYRSRILNSVSMVNRLWRTNVFSESIENAKDAIYRSAEIQFTVADATTSALSTINVASAQQTLSAILNMTIFRMDIELTGNQSSFGAAISAAIALIILPTDDGMMSGMVFDDLCNLVFNELIAWATERPTFVKRTGATNAFEAHVNLGGGNLNRDIINYMRYVLLRRPWAIFQRTQTVDYQTDIMLPNIDPVNINDQAYMAMNSLLSGISAAAQRNPNPGRQIAANSFRKLIKSMKDMCSNNIMPLIRLIQFNVERVARIMEFLPYSADIGQLNQNMRDERLRVKIPVSGFLSIIMGINKAPDNFDWGAMLAFADEVRRVNYAEREAIENVTTYVVLKNDGNRSVSKKDTFLERVETPTETIKAITKIPSASLTTILSDRLLVNEIRNTRTYALINRLIDILKTAFDNVPTSHHGVGKGALLFPYPRRFGRSSVYVRKDNIIFNRPQGVNRYNVDDLLHGRFYQGLMGQVQNMQPVFIDGPMKLRTSDPTAIESITSAYLTMSAPYDAYIHPMDLKHNKVIEPREVDFFVDDKPTKPHEQFEEMMSKTSVFILDAQRLIVQSGATNYNFNYHDMLITDKVVDKLQFSTVLPPDVTLFNGVLVYEA
uniref:Core capsid protein VP2 n=1 Tax=Rotavirus G TaxID=183407 RepID=A0A024CEZ8_9REOV|nr:core capsid protein VP2 [Rotavirus G]